VSAIYDSLKRALTKLPLPVRYAGCGVVGFLGVSVLLELFLRSRSNTWAVAIEASSTIALVVVTSVYVAFTSRLVDLQRDSARTAAQEEAMRGLLQSIGRKDPLIHLVERSVPFEISAHGLQIVNEIADGLADIGAEVRNGAALLPPKLFVTAMNTGNDLSGAAGCCLALSITCLKEITNASASGTDWTADTAKARWYSERAQGLDTRHEWEDVVQGKESLIAIKSLASLRVELALTLQHDPKSGLAWDPEQLRRW
jgi:hypothetical protein